MRVLRKSTFRLPLGRLGMLGSRVLAILLVVRFFARGAKNEQQEKI
jgi:hypothetical protein